VALTLGVAAVSFVLSFASLSEAALWGRVRPGLAWCVPVLVDASMLVYTAAALIQRARGERAGLSWSLLGLFSGVSVVANAAHGWGLSGLPQLVVGTVLVSLAPVGVLASVHTLASLVTKHPEKPMTDAPTSVTELQPEPQAVLFELHGPNRTRGGRKRTPASVARAIDLWHAGATQAQIAEALGWSKTLVQTVLREHRRASEQVAA
jgi:hypothetical protein